MKKLFTYLSSLSLLFLSLHTIGQSASNYKNYHQQVIQAEELVAKVAFDSALDCFDQLFYSYEFVFVRECQIATQLAILTNQNTRAKVYLKMGLLAGWKPKDIKKSKSTKLLLKELSKEKVQSLESLHHDNIDQQLKMTVKEMFKADQKMAIKNLFKIGDKAKIRYAETKFAPHSEQQLLKLDSILIKKGYPGEQLIGDGVGMSTILCHHNSISPRFNKTDTLYDFIQPHLIEAVNIGQMSPFEYALIEDWRFAVNSNHDLTMYGFLGKIREEEEWKQVNENRAKIGLRSLELRNQLIEMESQLDIDLYLGGEPWRPSQIRITK